MFGHSVHAHQKAQSPQKNLSKLSLEPSLNFKTFIQILTYSGQMFYPSDHNFLCHYLLTFFREENYQLMTDFQQFKKDIINQSKLSLVGDNRGLNGTLLKWVHHEKGPLAILSTVWMSYMLGEIAQAKEYHNFLTHETNTFARTCLKTLTLLYPSMSQIQSLKLQFELIDYLTSFSGFKDIMQVYYANFDPKIHRQGQFTPSQIKQTVDQLQKLVGFSQLTHPFAKSINLMSLFYSQHCLKKKLKYLVASISQIKSQILEYRDHLDLGPTVIGSDQMFPVVNYVCEKCDKNLAAAVWYINSLIGQNMERRMGMLEGMEGGGEVNYCLQLVEAVGGVYCHASQFLAP